MILPYSDVQIELTAQDNEGGAGILKIDGEKIGNGQAADLFKFQLGEHLINNQQ